MLSFRRRPLLPLFSSGIVVGLGIIFPVPNLASVEIQNVFHAILFLFLFPPNSLEELDGPRSFKMTGLARI